MMHRRIALTAVLVACCASGGLAVAQEPAPSPSPAAAPTASPSIGAPVSPGTDRRDLLLDLPTQLGGMDAQAEVVRGEEHFADVDAGDAASREAVADLAGMLDRMGASADDLSSGYALVSLDDLFAFTFAVRVEGAEAGTLLPAYLPILLGDLVEPSTAEAMVEGKDVLVITTKGDAGEDVDLYVYDAGDTVWMVQGPDDVVASVLAGLP